MAFNSELLFSATLLIILLQHSPAQPNESANGSPSHLNRSLHLSISSMKNKTGHWIALYSVHSNATRLSSHWNADLNLNTRANGDIESVHAVGTYVETPNIAVITHFSKKEVPARYTLYPGIGYYKFYNSASLTFYEAFYNCSADGGHLAIINSEEEARVLREFWKINSTGGSFVYLGFNDLVKEGEFRTIFGQTLEEAGYNEWGPNEPAKSNCGFFDDKALHRVMACTNKRPFLCEFPLSNTR